MNPSYGQLSSVADLVKLMQTFLDSSRPGSLISSYTLREWLRPTYALMDDMTEVGLGWEILKISDSYDRKQRVYQKCMLVSPLAIITLITLFPQWVNSWDITLVSHSTPCRRLGSSFS